MCTSLTTVGAGITTTTQRFSRIDTRNNASIATKHDDVMPAWHAEDRTILVRGRWAG